MPAAPRHHTPERLGGKFDARSELDDFAVDVNRAAGHDSGGTTRVSGGRRRRQPFLSHALSGQDIDLEEVEGGIWNIVYYQTLLGKIDERTARVTGIVGRT